MMCVDYRHLKVEIWFDEAWDELAERKSQNIITKNGRRGKPEIFRAAHLGYGREALCVLRYLYLPKHTEQQIGCRIVLLKLSFCILFH